MSDSTAVLVHRTACPLDCPDTCTLAVEVRGQEVLEVSGWPRSSAGGNPFTDGLICGKVRRFARHVDCPERLATPLLRRGRKGAGEFEPVTWEQAFEIIVQRLTDLARVHGSESLLPVCYGGSNGLLSQDAADALFFRRFGAARILRTLCAMPTGAALDGLYGKMPGVVPDDWVHSRLLVLWGVNPHASGIHAVPRVDRAREAGAKLVVIDPRRTPLAKQADLHLALRPGTDLVLALALHRWLFEQGRADLRFLGEHCSGHEALRAAAQPWTVDRAAAECGLEPAQIERLAQLYADTRPAVVRLGWGQERNRNGGSSSAAIVALPAVAGHFGVRGGGYTASFSGAWKGRLGAPVDAPDRARREVNLNRLGRELCSPSGAPLHGLFVYNCNPLQTVPDQERVRRGLEREDLFTVVFDAVHTDTADYADVVLPATTFFEHRDLARSYGNPALLPVEPVIEPRGQARSNHAVFLELARRLGLLRPEEQLGEDDLRGALLAPLRAQGLDLAALDRDGHLEAPSGPRPVPFVDVFPNTPDGKVHLFPADLDRAAPLGLYGYQPDPRSAQHPLTLISPAVPQLVSSTFGQLLRGQVPVHLHPDDARERGLAEGAAVRVFNGLGEVHCELHLDADLRPGVASLPKGLWARHTANGRSSNALCPDTLSDLGGGSCFNDARVQVAARG